MNLVKIEDKELVIKEWNGERVVTAKDIAELHERDVKRVNEQFNRNIDKFELGKDYFQLTREEMRKSQFATALSKYSNNDIENLFTERGYLKLTEIFQMIAKKDGFKATNAETGKDISDEVIENEIGMERIDIESIEFLIYKEWKKWWRNI